MRNLRVKLNQDFFDKISIQQEHISYQQIGHKFVYTAEHGYDVMIGTEYFVSLYPRSKMLRLTVKN